MRAILQRVRSASVEVEGEIVGAIGIGILALVGVEQGDGLAEVEVLADRLAKLRVFADPAGKMNLPLTAVAGAVLVVSQFTLAASLAKGRRPSFNAAAPPAIARSLIDQLINRLRELQLPVSSGRFGTHMEVTLINDGPVTFVLEVKDGRVL